MLLSLIKTPDLISLNGDKGLFHLFNKVKPSHLPASHAGISPALLDAPENSLLHVPNGMVSLALPRPELLSLRLPISTLGKFSSLARAISTTLHSLPMLSSR